MKKALIPLTDGFEEIEIVAVADVLRRGGFEVTLAGVVGKLVTGMNRIVVQSDIELDNINPMDYDVIILAGGSDTDARLDKVKKVINIIKEYKKNDKYIAAICAAPVVLVVADILTDCRATVYPGLEGILGEGVYVDKDIVVSGKIITARGPATTIPFAIEIIKQLSGSELAEKVSKEICI